MADTTPITPSTSATTAENKKTKEQIAEELAINKTKNQIKRKVEHIGTTAAILNGTAQAKGGTFTGINNKRQETLQQSINLIEKGFSSLTPESADDRKGKIVKIRRLR